jgi:hypothetical protein
MLCLAALRQRIANWVDKQYYWAQPWQFTTNKDSFVNKVHIAEVEVHGNWHWFTIEKNCCDGVDLSGIPGSGYGGGAGGTSVYWIFHSCQVIPTATDYSAADHHLVYDFSWPIFNGFHAAVGYRTDMWIGDSIMPTFAFYISLRAAYVSAWLTIVHDDTSDYRTFWGNGQMYFDKNRGFEQPMGRASAVFVTGHGNDNVLQLEDLGRLNSMSLLWYGS